MSDGVKITILDNPQNYLYKAMTRQYAWWHYRRKEAETMHDRSPVSHTRDGAYLSESRARRASHHGWMGDKKYGYRHVSFGVERMFFNHMWS